MRIMTPRTLNALLSLVGLMRIAEHEAWLDTAGKSLVNSERDLKKAEDTARRMLNDRNRIAAEHGILEREREAVQSVLDKLNDEVEALRPDALLWRKARDKRAHDRKDSKKGVSRG